MMRIVSLLLFCLCVLGGVGSFARMAGAELPACVSEVEREAMFVRSFQSYLMVAAVACSQDKAYNEFISMYKAALSADGERLRGYFKRAYGDKGSEKHLTDFVTDLANVWSQVHMSDMNGYCKGTWETMWYLTHGSRATYDNVVQASRQVAGHPAAVHSLCSGAVSAAPVVSR